MKRSGTKWIMAIKLTATCLLLAFILLFTVSLTANKMFADVWQQLGIPQSEGNNNIFFSVANGYLAYRVKDAKKISEKDRVLIINQLVAYAKKYTSSEEFKKKYEKYRQGLMPAKPFTSTIDVDSIRAAEKQRIQMQIKQTEANANHANPKVRNGVPTALERLSKEMKTIEDGTCACIQNKVKQMESWNNAALNQYKKDMEKFDQRAPANPQDLIRRRLQEMLDITADVDFDAELKESSWSKNGKTFKVFVNPVYEKKSKDWKLAFRARKETTDLVRAAAQKWLSEIASNNQQRFKGSYPVGG